MLTRATDDLRNLRVEREEPLRGHSSIEEGRAIEEVIVKAG
jgi:hypothetical protein